MARSEKAAARKNLSQLMKVARNCHRDMEFFFRHRHHWSEENGGYDYCWRRFLKAKRNLKSFRCHIVNATNRYLDQYSTAAAPPARHWDTDKLWRIR